VSPTARTLALLRQQGYLAGLVERYIHQARQTVDLFGVAGVLAVPGSKAVLLVQATSADHVAGRLARVRARPETALLLRAGLGVEVWGWRRSGSRWEVRRVAVRGEDLAAFEVTPKRRRGKRPVQPDLFDGA
jgi:hypothetical protein